MNDTPPPSSALEDYRATFGSSFDLRRLWADRRAILANPRLASEPRPPLGFPPLRFALTLVIVPMLALGWLSSQVAGFLYPDGPAPTPTELGARAVEASFDAYLGSPSERELRALVVPRDTLPPDAQAVLAKAREQLAVSPFAVPDAIGLRERSDALVAELQASALPDATRRAVAADLLKKARARRNIDRVVTGMLRSFMEGGTGMQAMSAAVLVLAAWRFRRSVRGDARFPRAPQAGALYLYYTTAKLFWISAASIAVYGVLAFASAAGDTALFDRFNTVNQWVALVSLVYLLCFSGTLARALRNDDDVLPKGAAFAIGRKILWSQLVSVLLIMIVALLAGVLVGAAATWWYLR